MHINSLAGYITSFLVVVKISTEYMTEYTMIYTHISMYIHVFLLVVAISLHRTLALARPSRPLNCGTPPSSHRDSRWGIRDGDPGWSELDGNNRRGVAGIPVFCSTFYGFIKSTFMSFFGVSSHCQCQCQLSVSGFIAAAIHWVNTSSGEANPKKNSWEPSEKLVL